MSRKRAWTAVLVVALALCCLVTLIGGGFLAARQFLPLRGLREREATLPTVHIYSPQHGDEVPLASNVSVQAEATTRSGRVVLLQLWADGQLVGETTGAAAGLSGSWTWMPLTPGDHTLTVRAYNEERDEGLATVRVTAREMADADLDGIADEADDCPDRPGLPQTDGCPPDDGWVPAVGEADRDGDSVPDPQDMCPDQPGAPDAQGCPTPQSGDADGDGVPDAEDRCAGNPGSADAGGCPQEPTGDQDGDGVLDPDDRCPDQPGPPENEGCPAPQSGDADGDGVPDGEDRCPNGAGRAEDGCPATEGGPGTIQGEQGRPSPNERTAPGLEEICPACEFIDGTIPEGQVFGDEERSGAAVEVEVTSLRTAVGWSRVFCYLYLNALEWGNQWERVPDIRQAYSLDPSGDPPGPGFWNVARYLGGEHGHLVTVEGPLRVMMQCYGHTGDPLAPATQSLGLLTREHGPADWNGQTLTARAQEGNDWFEISYRICSIPCEEAVIPPPYNLGMTVNESAGGIRSYVLHWRWSGDPAAIDGFRIYRDGARVATEYGADHPYTILSEATALPGCGREYRFEVRAYKGTQESASSNPYFSTGAPCGGRNSLMLAEAYGPWPWAADLRLTIRYRYNGDHGRPVVIGALPCQGEGDSCRAADPNLFYHTGAVVGPGEGMAEVHIYYGGTAPATTDGLHLYMMDDDGNAFAFRRVPLSIQWPSSGVDVEIRDVAISADRLEVTIRNSGYAPLQSWLPTLLLQTTDGHQMRPPSVPVVPVLPPGGPLIVHWPLSEEGWNLLRAGYEITVDPENQLAELNEANNTFVGTVSRLRITYEQVAFFNHGREITIQRDAEGNPDGFVGPGGQLLALIPGPGPALHGEMLQFKSAVRDNWVDNWTHNDLYLPHEEGWAAPISADPAAPLWRDLAGVFRIIRGSCYEEGYIDSTHYGAGTREEICGHLIARGFAPEQNWVEVRHTPGSPQRFWIYFYDVDVHYQWWPPDYVEEYETVCEFYTELTAGQLQSLPGEFTLGSAEEGCMVRVRVEETGP